MSKLELIHEVKSELKRVNRTIDQKITRGLPYAKDAAYHKSLVSRLAVMNRSRFLARSMRFASAFLF